jgi:hypothetical protein
MRIYAAAMEPHPSEIQFIDQQATRESLLRFAMSDAQKTADEAIKDPAQLGQFREAVAAVLAGLKGQDHERKQLEALENQFESHASTLQIIFDSEKQFRWSRDLLPIIRISSVLFFIEVFAGFFLALSRREESLALYWKKVRRVPREATRAPRADFRIEGRRLWRRGIGLNKPRHALKRRANKCARGGQEPCHRSRSWDNGKYTGNARPPEIDIGIRLA